MSNSEHNKKNNKRRADGRSEPHRNPIRVRGKRLDEVNEDKLTLAYWLLAKRLVESGADLSGLTEPEVRAVAEGLKDDRQSDDSDASASAAQS